MPIAAADRTALLDQLTAAALEAGARIMEVYSGDFRVDYKDDESPVTEADARAEAVILAHLGRIAAEIPVVAEEAHAAGARVTPGETFFLVDPLDGTREFIGRRDEFTVNIGLVENGVPTLGIVYAPALKRLFRGVPGRAEEVDSESRSTSIAVRVPPAAPVAVASRSHRDEATEAYLASLGISEFVSAGSSLKFCLIAAGEADIYPRFGPTCEWDTAAAHAVLTAAGGGVCGLDGSPFAYGKAAGNYLNPGFIAWGGGPQPPAAG